MLQRGRRDARAHMTGTAAAVAAAAVVAAAALVPVVVHGGAQHGVGQLVVLPGVHENHHGAWKALPLYPLLADKQVKLEVFENLCKIACEDQRPGTELIDLQLNGGVLSAQQLTESVLGARQLSEGLLDAQRLSEGVLGAQQLSEGMLSAEQLNEGM